MTEKYLNRRNKHILFFLVLFVAIAVGITGFLYVQNTPRYSLYKFKKAILNHDAENALNYLDTDSIVDNMAKDMFSRQKEQKESTGNKLDTSMKGIGKDIVTQNLPTIKKQLREQLRSAIISYNDHTVLDNLSRASVLGLEIISEGDQALVKTRGKDKVAFKMAKSPEGRWRIVAFNLEELSAPGRN